MHTIICVLLVNAMTSASISRGPAGHHAFQRDALHTILFAGRASPDADVHRVEVFSGVRSDRRSTTGASSPRPVRPARTPTLHSTIPEPHRDVTLLIAGRCGRAISEGDAAPLARYALQIRRLQSTC